MKITSAIKARVWIEVERQFRPAIVEMEEKTKHFKVIASGGAPLPDGRFVTPQERDAIFRYVYQLEDDLYETGKKRADDVLHSIEELPEPEIDSPPPLPDPPFFRKEGEHYINMGKSNWEQIALYPLLPITMLGSGILQGGDFLIKKGIVPAAKATGTALEGLYDWLKPW